jgi:hypothetical protein
VPTKAPTSSLKLFRLRNPFQGLSSIIKPLHLARTQKIAFVSNSRVAAVAALSYFCTRLYIRIIELWNHAWMNSLWFVSSQDRPRGSHSFLMLSISAMALRLETAKGQGDLFGLRTATKEKNTYNIMCIIYICIYICCKLWARLTTVFHALCYQIRSYILQISQLIQPNHPNESFCANL